MPAPRLASTQRTGGATLSVDDTISNLEAASEKLKKAKTDGLNVIGTITQARNSVSHALGRSGSRSPLLAEIAAKEKALLTKIMAIDTLTARIDAAIQQARNIGDTGREGTAEPPS